MRDGFEDFRRWADDNFLPPEKIALEASDALTKLSRMLQAMIDSYDGYEGEYEFPDEARADMREKKAQILALREWINEWIFCPDLNQLLRKRT